jgi:predicted alpha-1,6-mannanase (GH76 family)
VLTATAATVAVVPSPASAAGPAVCALYCDTRDPSLAKQETFPVAERTINGRRVDLHVDDVSGMGWASIDGGVTGDGVWLDRSWDGGATWDGLLGKASVPAGWTGTRTLMYNLSDPETHRRGEIRACGDGAGVVCSDWVHAAVCDTVCDGATTGSGDTAPVPATTLSGRTIALHVDYAGTAWGTISGGRAGDEVWLDRSFDGGATWPGGSSLGRTSVGTGLTSAGTVRENIDDPRSLLYGGAVRACGRAVEGANGSCTAWARSTAHPTDAAADALLWSYDPDTAWWPSSWWNSAVALQTVIDYLRQSGAQRYTWIIDRSFSVNRVAFPAGARSGDPIDGDFVSRSTDDSEWWALAWLDAYDLTGNAAYLNEAATIATYVAGLWDGTCGGGVWWDRERTYKNAVTNGLYVVLTAQLHNRIAGDTAWLSRATAAWNWFAASGMTNASGLVNDGIDASCRNNGQQVWTYNQGLAMGAALEMWRATGNAALLATARRYADAGIASLTQNGVLTESCDAVSADCDDNAHQFKGVFMRYLADLNGATGGAYTAFASAQSASVWTADRTTLVQLGGRWSGATPAAHPNVFDWRTQASALSALLAAPPTADRIVGLGGRCVDVPGSHAVDGQYLQEWTCNNTGAQAWTFSSDGTVRALGLCLAVAGGSLVDGAVIQLATCGAGAAQRFVLTPAGRLLNPQSGKCVDVLGGVSSDGARLQQLTCSGAAGQKWYRS